jgi:hypothetical protein
MAESVLKQVAAAVNITFGESNGYVYFFHLDGTYSRFNRLTCELEYYADIAKEWNDWPADWGCPSTGLSWDHQYVYFIGGPEAIRYDMLKDKVDGSKEPVEKLLPGWPAAWLDRVDAGLYWGYHFGQKRRKAYFFRDDEYLRYDLSNKQFDVDASSSNVTPLKIKEYWPGWPAHWAAVWAAVDWGNGKVYFFAGDEYLRYDKFSEHVDPGYPRPLRDFLKEHKEKLASERKSLMFEDQIPAPQRAAFVANVRSLAKELEIRPNWLMASMWAESGFKPNAGVDSFFVGLHQLSLDLIYRLWGRTALAAQFPDLFPQGTDLSALTDQAKKLLAQSFAALGFEQIHVIGSWLRGSFKNLKHKSRSFDQLRLIGFGGKGLGEVDRTLLAPVVAKGNPRYDLSKDGKIDIAEFRAAVFDLMHSKFKDQTKDSAIRHDLG